MFGIGEMIGAGINFVGGLIQQNTQQQMAEDQRASEWRASNVQMDFQREMSGSAHQREAEDLRKAGLNRILSGTGGMGSTTPGGAKGSFSQGLPPPNLTEGPVAAYQAMRRNKAEVDNIDQDTKLKDRLEKLSSRDWNVRYADEKLRLQQHETEKENTRGAKALADIHTSDAKGRAIEGEIDTGVTGNILRYLDRIMRSLHGTAGPSGGARK